MKKFLTLFMSVLLLLAPFSAANADDIYDYIWEDYTDTWTIASVYDNGRTSQGDSWRLCYVGYPASQTGDTEYRQFHSDDDEIKTSGTLSVPIQQLEEALSLSFDNSAPAPSMRFSYKQGEYVRVYLRSDYQTYTLLQCGTRSGTGRPANETEASDEGNMPLTDIPCGIRPYEILIPLLPQIKVEHYNHLEDPLSTQGIRTEIYTCIDINGGYACTASYIRPCEDFSEDEESSF